jgi:DNA-binding Lrp family transcriptional regulator
MKLTAIQRELVPLIELAPHASVESIAKATGHRTHVVQYALSQLRQGGVLRLSPLVDCTRLGFLEFTVLMNLVKPTSESRGRFIRELLRSQRVTWVGELGGDFRFCAAVIAKNAHELASVLEGVIHRAKTSLLQKQISVVENLVTYPRKYLGSHKRSVDKLGLGSQGEPVTIDARDHQILSGLILNDYHSHRQLAAQLEIPLSSMELRVRRMEELGVIAGFRYVASSRTIGAQYVQIKVVAPSIDAKLTLAIEQWAQQHPHVIMYHRLLGAWDYEFGVEVSELSMVTSVADDFINIFGERISSLSIHPLLQEHFTGSYPYLQ